MLYGIYYILAVVCLSVGVFVYAKPKTTFEIQRKFYALINWRIEPIDMNKEIRNTKIMGLFLIVFVLATSLWLLLK